MKELGREIHRTEVFADAASVPNDSIATNDAGTFLARIANS